MAANSSAWLWWPIPRRFGQHGAEPIDKAVRNRACERFERRFFVAVLRDYLKRLTHKRRLAGEHEPERAAERINVAPEIDYAVGELFRAGKAGCADQFPSGQFGCQLSSPGAAP